MNRKGSCYYQLAYQFLISCNDVLYALVHHFKVRIAVQNITVSLLFVNCALYMYVYLSVFPLALSVWQWKSG